jgi:hypothetical protein
VNVAVPGVTKAGDRKCVLSLERFREFHEVDQTTPWYHHVLV